MMTSKTKALWDAMATASAAHNEHNDCTVKALSAATGIDYADCHKAMAKAGRKNRRGCHFHITGRDAAKALGFKMETVPDSKYSAKTMITAERDRALKSGRYVLRVRGHVAALVDGKIVDWSQGRRHIIKSVYQFTPIAAAPAPKVHKIPAGTAKWLAFTKYKKSDNLELF